MSCGATIYGGIPPCTGWIRPAPCDWNLVELKMVGYWASRFGKPSSCALESLIVYVLGNEDGCEVDGLCLEAVLTFVLGVLSRVAYDIAPTESGLSQEICCHWRELHCLLSSAARAKIIDVGKTALQSSSKCCGYPA